MRLKHFLSTAILGCLFIPLGYADVNLLDELKAGRAKFSISPYCKTFLQTADHSTFQSSSVQKALVPLSDLKLGRNSFFHYSDDYGGELSRAVRQNNFRPILEYLFTYNGFSGNVRGGGLYMAANPFSSANYGAKQTILEIDPTAKVFEEGYLTSSAMSSAIREINRRNSSSGHCDGDLLKLLILDENGTDILFYDKSSEWFVLLNEEVITSSKYLNIGKTDKNEIMKKMVSQGALENLGGLISETNSKKRPNSFSLLSLINSLDSYSLSKGSTAQEIKQMVLASKGGESYSALVDTIISRDLMKAEVFENIPLDSTVGSAHRQWLVDRITIDPKLVELWNPDLYLQNFSDLIDRGLLTRLQYFDLTKDPRKILALFESDWFQKFIESDRKWAVDLLFTKYSSLVATLSPDAVLRLIHRTLDVDSPAKVSKLITQLEKLKYPMGDLYKVLPSATANEDRARAFAFISEYVMRQKGQNLLSENALRFMLTGSDIGIKKFIQDLRLKFLVSSRDLVSLAGKDWSSFGEDQLEFLITIAEEDSLVLSELLDLSLDSPLKRVLKSSAHVKTSLSLIQKYHSQIMANIEGIPALPQEVGELLFAPGSVAPYLAGVSPTRQWLLARRVMEVFPGEHEIISTQVAYDSAIAAEAVSILRASGLGDLNTLESYVNNKVFVSKLNTDDFSFLISQLVRHQRDLELQGLFEGNVLDLGRDLILLSQLTETQGQENLSALAQSMLSHLTSPKDLELARAELKKSKMSFLERAFNLNDDDLDKKLVGFLKQNYPLNVSSDVVSEIVAQYSRLSESKDAQDFMLNYLCTKVNKHKAFSEYIDSIVDKNKKKEAKALRKSYCEAGT